LSAKPLKFDLKLLRTVIPSRELLHLRRVFPAKPNIKTYVALCESCRSIAPLQLLVLEILKLVGTFESYTFLKSGPGNEKRRRRRAAASACERARPYSRIHVAILRSSGVRLCRGMSLWTQASPWTLRPASFSCAASSCRPRRGTEPRAVRTGVRAHASAGWCPPGRAAYLARSCRVVVPCSNAKPQRAPPFSLSRS
jgi:hypothetical protein